MLVTLIGKDRIFKLQLPQVVKGNYWLSDKTGSIERKLINIEEKNGKWQIVSNNYSQIINPSCIHISDSKIEVVNSDNRVLDKIILQECGMYGIMLDNSNELCLLYCSSIYEENIMQLDINDTEEILVGSGKECDIQYSNRLVLDKHARLSKNNGNWIIENFDTKFGTFVNNDPIIEGQRVLHNGDVIFIMGLKIIIVGNCIYINNPLDKVLFDLQKFSIHEQKIDINTKGIREDDMSELYTEKDYFFRSPRITSKIERERVRIDAPPQIQDKEEMPMILVLGTSLTMGLMMVLSMSSAIKAQINGTAKFGDTLFSMFLSVLMLVGIIIFPMLTVKYERRRKVEYEKKRQERYKKYINKKSEKIENIMEKQRNILSETYASPEECYNIISNRTGRLWERKIEDNDFLSVRLGTGNLPLDIDIQYPEERICNAR